MDLDFWFVLEEKTHLIANFHQTGYDRHQFYIGEQHNFLIA